MKDDCVQVEILMATYEGAGFLREQLDSLRVQTHSNWRLRVRDDGSRDATPAILEAFASEEPARVELETGSSERLGAAGCYSHLMGQSHADYAMFCDQDDVWDSDKIEISLAAMRELEARSLPGTPLLVHTDLRVVDASRRLLDDSLWHYQNLDPRAARRLTRLLVQNVVTGCTCLANRSLLERAGPVPRGAVMHDWWLALVAAAFGGIHCLPRATLDYRQHSGNRLGARRFDRQSLLESAVRPFDRASLIAGMRDAAAQAGAFLDRYGEDLGDGPRGAVSACAGLLDRGFVGRRLCIVRHGLWKVGLLRNLATLLRI